MCWHLVLKINTVAWNRDHTNTKPVWEKSSLTGGLGNSTRWLRGEAIGYIFFVLFIHINIFLIMVIETIIWRGGKGAHPPPLTKYIGHPCYVLRMSEHRSVGLGWTGLSTHHTARITAGTTTCVSSIQGRLQDKGTKIGIVSM